MIKRLRKSENAAPELEWRNKWSRAERHVWIMSVLARKKRPV
jgi:hypothetical protein